jgi:ribonuclease HI
MLTTRNQEDGGRMIIACRDEYAEIVGPQSDMSNSEMELKAMLEALSRTLLYSPIVIESDSQLCIDTRTTYAKRWSNNGWMKSDGKPAENLHRIEPLMSVIE